MFLDTTISPPRLVYWMMGAVFSNITCRLIVSQMSNTESPAFNTLLIPLSILVIAIWMPSGKVGRCIYEYMSVRLLKVDSTE